MSGVAGRAWPEVRLGEIGHSLIGLTYSPSNVKLSGTLVLRSSNIQDGRLTFEDNVYVDCAIPERIRVQENDMLICVRNGSRRLIGKSVMLDRRVVGQTFGAFMAVFRSRANPFLRYFFQSSHFKRQIDEHLGATINQITNASLNSFVVSLPSPEEQQAIAASLADVDRYIAGLERMIAKKQAIKQGMMQQLLTGKTRLPGFTGEWTTRKIGDFAHVTAGGTPSTNVPRYWGGNVRWMSSGEIHAKRVYEIEGRITGDGLRESAAQLLPVGTVLLALAGQGKTRGTVAVSRVALSTNQSIAGILPTSEHEPDFLFYNLDTRYEELRGESSGHGGRGGLNLTILKSLEVFMPPRDEQKAIAGVLADTDDEIDLMKRRLVKARDVKQGMLEELLTGRTRLPLEGEVA